MEPVNATFVISGCELIAWPAVGPNQNGSFLLTIYVICKKKESITLLPYPGTTFKTPGGTPASTTNDAAYNADNGVCSAIFKTVVRD